MATLRERIRAMQEDPLYDKLSDEQKRWHLDQILKEYPGEEPTEAAAPEAPEPEWLQKMKDPGRIKTIADVPVLRPRLVSGREGMGVFGTRPAPPPEELSPTAAVMQRFLGGAARTATAGRVQPQAELTPEQMEIGGRKPELIGGGAGFAVGWPAAARGVAAIPGGKRLLDLGRGATLRRQAAQQVAKAAKRGGVPAEGAGRLIRRELLRESGLHGTFNTLVGAVYGGVEALERDDIITRLKAMGEMGAYGGAVGTVAPVIGSVINALRSQPSGPLTKEGLAALFEQYGRAAKPPPPAGVGRLALPPAQIRPTGPPTPATGPLTPTPRPMPTGAAVPAGRPPLALTGQVGPLPPVPPGPYPLLERGAIPMPPPAREGGFPVEFPREPITEITPSEAVAPMQTQARDTVTRMYRQYFAPASPFRRVAGGKFGPRKSVSVEEVKRAFGDEGEEILRNLAGVKGSKVRLRTTPEGEERYSWEKGYGLASALKHTEELQPLPTEELVPEVEPSVPETPAIPPELEPPTPIPEGEQRALPVTKRELEFVEHPPTPKPRPPTGPVEREITLTAEEEIDQYLIRKPGTFDRPTLEETKKEGERFKQLMNERWAEMQVEPPPPEEVATVEAPTAPELPPEYSTPAAQREVIKAVNRLEGGATDMTVKADFVNTFRAWDMTDESIQRMWTEVRTQGKPLVSEAEWLEANPQYEIDVINAGSAIAETGNVDAGKDLLQGKVPEGELALAGNAAIHEALNQIYIRTDLKPETVRKLINQIDRQRGGLPWNWHRNKALRSVHQIVDELGMDELSSGTKVTESDYDILKLAVSKGRVRTAAEMSGEEVQTVLNILKTLKRQKQLGLSEMEFNSIVRLATGRDSILHASMDNAARVNTILGDRKYTDVLFEVGDALPPLYVPEKDMPFPYNKIAQLRPVRHTILDDTGIYALADSYHHAKSHFEREWLGAVSEQLGKVRWQSATELEPVMRALEGEVVDLTPEHQHAVDTLRGMWDRLHKVFNVPKYRRDYAPHIVDWDATLKLVKSDTPEGKKLAEELNRMGFKATDKPWKIVRDLRTEIAQLQHDYFIPDYVDFFARHRRYDNLQDMLPTIRHPVRLAEIYIRAGAAWKFYNPMVNMVRPLLAHLQPETRKLAEKYVGEVLGRRARQEADLAKGLQQVMVAVGQTPDMGGLDAIARMITDATYVQYLGIPRIGSSVQNLTQGLLIIPVIGPGGTLRGATRVFKGVDEARYRDTVTESLPAESLERPTDVASRAGEAWNKGTELALSLFRAVDVFLRRVAFSGGVDGLERVIGSFSTPQDLQGMREWLESGALRGQLSGEIKMGSNAIMRSASRLPAKAPLRKLQELVAGVEDKGLRWKIIQGLRSGDVEASGNAYGDYVQKSSQFGYGPVESPLMFRGSPVMRVVSTFISYPLNYTHHMSRQASLARRAYKEGNYRMAADQTFKLLYYFMSAAGLAKAAEEVLDADIWEWFVTGELPGRVPLWIKRAYNVGVRLPMAALQREFGGYEEWEEREFQETIREIGRDFMVPHFQLGVRDLMEARDAWSKGGKDALREMLGLRKFKTGEILLPGQRGPRGIKGPKGRGLIRE